MDKLFEEFLKSKGLLADFKGYVAESEAVNTGGSSSEAIITEGNSSLLLIPAAPQSHKLCDQGNGDSASVINQAPAVQEAPPKSEPKLKKQSVSNSDEAQVELKDKRRLKKQRKDKTPHKEQKKHGVFKSQKFPKIALKGPKSVSTRPKASVSPIKTVPKTAVKENELLIKPKNTFQKSQEHAKESKVSDLPASKSGCKEHGKPTTSTKPRRQSKVILEEVPSDSTNDESTVQAGAVGRSKKRTQSQSSVTDHGSSQTSPIRSSLPSLGSPINEYSLGSVTKISPKTEPGEIELSIKPKKALQKSQEHAKVRKVSDLPASKSGCKEHEKPFTSMMPRRQSKATLEEASSDSTNDESKVQAGALGCSKKRTQSQSSITDHGLSQTSPIRSSLPSGSLINEYSFGSVAKTAPKTKLKDIEHPIKPKKTLQKSQEHAQENKGADLPSKCSKSSASTNDESKVQAAAVGPSRKRTVSQSNQSGHSLSQTSPVRSSLPAAVPPINEYLLGSIANIDAGKSFPKKARRSSTSVMSSDDEGRDGSHEFEDLALSKVTPSYEVKENLLGPECFVRLTRIPEQVLLKLSPNHAKQGLSGTDTVFAVPSKPSVKRIKFGGYSKSAANNTVTVSKLTKKKKEPESKDTLESSSATYPDFFKLIPQIDPLVKVDMETNELDFEPAADNDDDADDAISLFPDANMFENDDEDVTSRYSRADRYDDSGSEASCGSTHSGRWSCGMELDENSDDDSQLEAVSESPMNSQLEAVSKSPVHQEIEEGIVVENYGLAENQGNNKDSSQIFAQVPSGSLKESAFAHVPSEGLKESAFDHVPSESLKESAFAQVPSESLKESAVSASRLSPAKAAHHSIDMHHKDENMQESVPFEASAMEEESAVVVDKANNHNELKNLQGGSNSSTLSSPEENLHVESQEKSVMNGVKLVSGVKDISSSDTSTPCKSSRASSQITSTTGVALSDHVLDKASDDKNIKKPCRTKSSVGVGSDTSSVQHSTSLQTGVQPVVQLVNPQPRATAQQSEVVPRMDYQGGGPSVHSIPPNYSEPRPYVDRPGPALLPTPSNPAYSLNYSNSTGENRPFPVARDGRTGLLPTPRPPSSHVPPCHPVNVPSLLPSPHPGNFHDKNQWPSPPSTGSTPTTTPLKNMEARLINPEVSVFASENSVPQRQSSRILQPVLGHLDASRAQNLPHSQTSKLPMLPRGPNDLPKNPNQCERNLRLQDHPDSSHRPRRGNNTPFQPWEIQGGQNLIQPQDHEAASRRDVDMRNQPPFQGSGIEFLLSNYCTTFLKSGKCSINGCCTLIHETPRDVSCNAMPTEVVVQLVGHMVSTYPYWMSENLKGTIEMLGKYGEKSALVRICEPLWKRDCSFKPSGYLEYSSDFSHWAMIAEGLRNCALAPSKAVKEILLKVISTKTVKFDVLDKVVDALYNDFIKDQSNVWESISPLLQLEGYEIPIPVMTEVLKDAIQDTREKLDHIEISDYLLRSPVIEKPRKHVERTYMELIQHFIRSLTRSSTEQEYAGRLRNRFKIGADCSASPVCAYPVHNLMPVNVRTNNTRNRFQFPRRRNIIPIHEVSNQKQETVLQSPPRIVNEGLLPTLPKVSQGSGLRSKRKSFSMNKTPNSTDETASSSEGILGPTEAASDHNDPKAAEAICTERNAVSNSNYEALKIVIEGTNRTTVLSNVEASSRQPDAAGRPSSDVRIASSIQPSHPPRNLMAKASTKRVDGIRPIAPVSDSDKPTMPATESKTMLRGRGVSSSSGIGASVNNLKNSRTLTSRLLVPDICTLIESKKYGVASRAIVNMQTPEERRQGITLICASLKKFDYQESINSFKYLLAGTVGTWSGAVSDSSSKSVITSVGLLMLKHLMENSQWDLAIQLNENLCSRVDPLSVEVEQFSKAYILLMRAKVLFHSGKFPEALKIVEDNKFYNSPKNWTYPMKNHENVELRDELCLTLLKKCISIDAYNGKVDSLFRSMVISKDSYKLDVGAQYSAVLRCLLHAKLLPLAMQLLFWAENHKLKPDPITSRLLLGKILHLNNQLQNEYTPHVVFLLSLEPYKEALPQSLQGIERATVSLQSNWFDWEIRAIITFLTNCHLSNLPEGQGFPDLEIEVKAAVPPTQTPGEEHFPTGLMNIDASPEAMKGRVLKILQEFQLARPGDYFSGDVLSLNGSCIRERVENRRHSFRGTSSSVRGHGILNASNAGSRASRVPPYQPSHQQSFNRRENIQQIANPTVGWFDQSNDMRNVESILQSEHNNAYGPQSEFRHVYTDQGMSQRNMPPHWIEPISQNSQNLHYNPASSRGQFRGRYSYRHGQRSRWN